jgi:transposase InsO family protein
VKRSFSAERPDQLWCTDITEHPTREGKVYCAAILDVFSRRIVGWSIADHIRSVLVVDALQMATWRRQPEPGGILHSDRGSHYASWIFGHRLREAGLLGSMGRVASSVDNTMMESFWSTMQRELLDRQCWDTKAELSSAIFEWIEAFYNPVRRHTSIRGSQPDRVRSSSHRRKSCGMITTTNVSGNRVRLLPFQIKRLIGAPPSAGVARDVFV